MRKLSDDEFIKIAVTYLPYYGGRVRLIKDLVVDTGLSKREVNNLLCRFTGKLWQFERHERGIHHFLPINLSDRAIISRGNHNHGNRVCLKCDESFIVRKHNQKYCSSRCRKYMERKRAGRGSDVFKAARKRHSLQSRQRLTDNYIRAKLREKHPSLKGVQIPQELITLKRAIITAKRAIANGQE